jgi:hypothetical protein
MKSSGLDYAGANPAPFTEGRKTEPYFGRRLAES